MLDAEQGIENYRFPKGLTNGEVFHRLNEGEYFYGTPLQGQDFCWEINVNLVTGTVLWKQMTETMCSQMLALFAMDLFCAGVLFEFCAAK